MQCYVSQCSCSFRDCDARGPTVCVAVWGSTRGRLLLNWRTVGVWFAVIASADIPKGAEVTWTKRRMEIDN